jgi:hypothetical protein
MCKGDRHGQQCARPSCSSNRFALPGFRSERVHYKLLQMLSGIYLEISSIRVYSGLFVSCSIHMSITQRALDCLPKCTWMCVCVCVCVYGYGYVQEHVCIH